MMDAKARLTEILDRRMEPTRPSLVAGLLADAVLAEFDLTPKPPAPAGPVTSEEAVAAYAAGYARASGVFREQTEEALANKCKAGMDAAMPLLAKDHGYIKLAEVERRAREWVTYWPGLGTYTGVAANSLVAALTREAK